MARSLTKGWAIGGIRVEAAMMVDSVGQIEREGIEEEEEEKEGEEESRESKVVKIAEKKCGEAESGVAEAQIR